MLQKADILICYEHHLPECRVSDYGLARVREERAQGKGRSFVARRMDKERLEPHPSGVS